MPTPEKLLIVDDNAVVRQIVVALMKKQSYAIWEAASGLAALRLASEIRPDLVLLDVNLPDISGLEVCRRIKADPSLASTFVVHLSAARTTSEHQVEGLDSGADGYIPWPVHYSELAARVQAILRIAKAERALRESEHRFRTLFDQAAVGMAEIDTASGGFLKANGKCCDITGYDRQSLEQSTFQAITHPDDWPSTKEHLDQLVAGTIREFAIEQRFLRPDGTFVWIRLTVSPAWAPGEPTTTHLAVIQDITWHKQAEDALRQSQSDLMRAESFSHIMVTHIGLDGRWLKVPPLLCRLLDYSVEELLSRRLQDVTHPEDAETDWRQCQLLLQSDLPAFSSEKRYRTKNSQDLWFNVNCSLIRNATGEPEFFLTYLCDITASKVSEDRIRAQAELLDLTQDAISIRDLLGHLLFWNKGAERIFGWTSSEVIGQDAHTLLSHHAGSCHQTALDVTLHTGQWSSEVERTTKAGRPLIVQSRWTLLKSAAGVPQSILVVETDITEKKLAEAQLQRVGQPEPQDGRSEMEDRRWKIGDGRPDDAEAPATLRLNQRPCDAA